MRRSTFRLLRLACGLALLVTLVLLPAAAWTIPRTINYQGILTDSSGLPQDGSLSFSKSANNCCR